MLKVHVVRPGGSQSSGAQSESHRVSAGVLKQQEGQGDASPALQFSISLSSSPSISRQGSPERQRRESTEKQVEHGAQVFQKHYAYLRRDRLARASTGAVGLYDDASSKPTKTLVGFDLQRSKSEPPQRESEDVGINPALVKRSSSLPSNLVASALPIATEHSGEQYLSDARGQAVGGESRLGSLNQYVPSLPEDQRVIAYLSGIGGVDRNGYVVKEPLNKSPGAIHLQLEHAGLSRNLVRCPDITAFPGDPIPSQSGEPRIRRFIQRFLKAPSQRNSMEELPLTPHHGQMMAADKTSSKRNTPESFSMSDGLLYE